MSAKAKNSGKNSKEEKQRAVALAILEVIEKDGLLGVTHSKVSRRSGVSRPWIYEYVGKEKSALIEFAADEIASHFARAKMGDLPKTKEELHARAKDGVDFLFDSTAMNAVAIKLYYRFRGTTNPLGQVIRKYEKRWLGDATKTLTDVLGLPAEQAKLASELVLTLRLGFAHRLATSSNAVEARENAQKIFDYIHALVPTR